MSTATAVRAKSKGSLPPVPSHPIENGSMVVMEITPEIAKDFGAYNDRNRKVSRHTIAAYARDMKARRWRYTGEPIKFSEDGKLLDGQQRLAACILAQTPFETLVIRGIDIEAQRVMDQGRRRTVADNLTIHGYKDATLLAAAAKTLLVFKEGESKHKHRSTSSEIEGMIDKHPLLGESCPVTVKAMGITRSLLTAIHYVGKHLQDEPEKADAFVRVFKTVEPSYPHDAAHAWCIKLIKDRELRTLKASSELMRGSIHAWNKFCLQEPVLRFQPPSVATFPADVYEKL